MIRSAPVILYKGNKFYLTEAAATIRVGDQLNITSRLVSEDGNFTLGFFSIAETNFSYLGIWYTNDDQVRKVWIANRNQPIVDTSATLTIDKTGKLMITSAGKIVVNISDQNHAGNISATLHDDGNFVLADQSDNHRVLWQSFDNPTNVLLPGMKLGSNLTDAKNWTLTSWFSTQDPAPGAFSLSWDFFNESNQLVIRRRGIDYWTSGQLMQSQDNQDKQVFEFMMVNNPFDAYQYNLSIGDDAEARYFTYIPVNGRFPMWILDYKGNILTGEPSINFATTAFCLGYKNEGCVANSGLPVCRSHDYRFEEKNADFINGKSTDDDNTNISLSDCMQRCWDDCSCLGFINHSDGKGCIMYFETNYTINDHPGALSRYVLISSKTSQDKKAKGSKWVWIVIAVGISLVLLILSSFCVWRMRKIRLQEEEKRKRDKYLQELVASDSFNNSDEVGGERREGHDLNFFSFGSIAAATNDFSDVNKLGQGGFGPVYKGKLLDGKEIAIKRLAKTSGQGLIEFKNELILIAKLQHTNLVRVLGCCIHGEEKMLIYEYMPNKSLDYFLFDVNKRDILDWQKRFNIIEGIGQGLLYLHKYSRMRVIHRDLKASNVLLDENMNPKISDFGMARIFKPNETQANTVKVVGTYGYMSPEYAMEGTFSVKSDVFSFGVLVLEIVSGRRNNSFYNIERPLNLIGYAWELWNGGHVSDLKDPTLEAYGIDVKKQLSRTIHIGLLCVQESADDRPDMSYVISMLGNETIALPVPKQPAFFTGRSVLDLTSSESKSKDISVGDMSITVMEAR
ncbi:Receptor-like serine/threonine-protein kinase [Heracleum sosnowskyi]|uniref:Receptor-like serine/threonine-protein kinase n=1 Tax=Heracleum sosnowskyi TaxID=360622 RepID=A0AAD8MIX8_9APIA|nr:Receptor-like serine/threonine-protein kinase [Heracleum sosnowskyi]